MVRTLEAGLERTGSRLTPVDPCRLHCTDALQNGRQHVDMADESIGGLPGLHSRHLDEQGHIDDRVKEGIAVQQLTVVIE
jgi:hypothetical protein